MRYLHAHRVHAAVAALVLAAMLTSVPLTVATFHPQRTVANGYDTSPIATHSSIR